MKYFYLIGLLFLISCSTGTKDFGNYQCTKDCSGHIAGYNWAKDKGINNQNDCGGKSNSFIEGCLQYVIDND